jgi:hypothetical protein
MGQRTGQCGRGGRLAGVPAEPPLTDDEDRVLRLLMEPDRKVADCTTEAIAAAIRTTRQSARKILRGLERRTPQLVRPEVDEGLGIQFWTVTYDATEAIEPPLQ